MQTCTLIPQYRRTKIKKIKNKELVLIRIIIIIITIIIIVMIIIIIIIIMMIINLIQIFSNILSLN